MVYEARKEKKKKKEKFRRRRRCRPSVRDFSLGRELISPLKQSIFEILTL